ncbi:MAG: hypothetical protein KDA59_20340, partial [Planctomycetales bacterium]|nr:hypothetical protein [Planctomycetales bacterium]
MMCVFVGCRGKQPAGSQANQKNAPSGQETRTRPAAPKGKGSDSGDERTAPFHPTTGNAAPMPDSGLTDWSSAMEYVPDYALLAAVVRPTQLLALPGVTPELLNAWRGEAPFSPAQVKQLVACIYPDSTRNSLAVGWSLRLDPRVPRRIVGHWLSPGATPAPDLQRVYLPAAERGLCYGFPDEETVICGPYRYVYEVMGAGSARAVETEATAAPETDAHPLRRWLSTAPVGAQLAVVADVERLRHFAEHFRGGYPEDRGVDLAVWSAKLPHGWQHAAAAVDFAEADGLWAEVMTSLADPSDVADRAAANWLEDRVEQAAQWLREQLAGDFHVALRQFDSEVRGWLAPLPWRWPGGGKLVLKGLPPAAAAVLTTAADLLGLRDLVSAKQRVDEQASMMLVRVGQALQNFYTENGRLPQDLITEDGQPLLSWRVELLPWLNEAPLLQLFRFDEPWDSE